ncbi:S8 family serine peptidase [Halomarina salina]|uniref:S8 family serine peptidase n=1 Tax=Halomarina salina TaxID=1872699 RepID=A0ABD5RNZ2_9EURY|nr:S8 family serine peptidase [Halomarina salina]
MAERIILVTGRPEFLYDCPCTVKETYDFGRWGSAALVEYDTEAEAASVLEADDRVHSIEENHTATLRLEPEYVSENPDDVATIEDVRRLHDVPAKSARGSGVTVVAMDSGVDTSHPVFSDATIEQVDVTGSGRGDAVGHGTAVLGQVTRLAPEADLVSLRIFGEQGQTKTNVIMRAYEWLHNNTGEYDVVNMSWGAQQRSEQIDRTHNELIAKGVRGVVAAGNSGEKGGSPATADRAFSVGACTVDGTMAEFSSYNPRRDNPDVTAIGKDNRLAQADGTTMGTELSGRWVKASGTSFSAPEVAGMVAKYLGVHPDAAPADIVTAFEETARDIKDQPRDGAGLADYRAAVGHGGAPAPSPPTEPSPEPSPDGVSATVWDTPTRDLLEVDADWLTAGEYTVTRTQSDGEGTTLRLVADGQEGGGSGRSGHAEPGEE